MNKQKNIEYYNKVLRTKKKNVPMTGNNDVTNKEEKNSPDSFITLINRCPIAVEYTFNLSDIEFEREKNLLAFLEVLRNATQQDVIKIYCSSNGGSVYVALRILNAIHDSDALIITIGDSYVHSAASLILLSGDIIEVKGFCNMLVHDVSSFVGGKSSSMANEISFQQDWKMDIFHKCYLGFLTKDEIKLLSEGKDYYFQSNEILKRLHNMAEHKKKNEHREIMIYDKKKFQEDTMNALKKQDEEIIKKLGEHNGVTINPEPKIEPIEKTTIEKPKRKEKK